MLRGKIFERNEEIRIGGQICPHPVCLGLRLNNNPNSVNRLPENRKKLERGR